MKLMYYSEGNGVYVCDRTQIDPKTGDYKRVAWISNGGNIIYYAKNISSEAREKVKSHAEEIGEKFRERFEKMDAITQFQTIMDSAPFKQVYNGKLNLREISKDTSSIIQQLPKLREIYYLTA